MVRLTKVKEKRVLPERPDKKKRWQMLTCKCDESPTCPRCKAEIAENSVPVDEFTVEDLQNDGTKTSRLVKEITVHRGSLDDVMGWSF